MNPYAQLIEEGEGLEKIENLESDDVTEICEKSDFGNLLKEDDAMSVDSQTMIHSDNNDRPIPFGGFNFS